MRTPGPACLGQHDPFSDVDAWDEATAAEWVERLDERSAAPDQQRLRREVVREARLADGECVVEIGCGSGALLVELAQAVGRNGRVIGIEPQAHLACAARERARSSDLADRIEVVAVRGGALPIESQTVDVCLAQTVLIHLPIGPARATIAEMMRVTRYGGRIIAAEQDCDTWAIDHPDRGMTRKVVAFNSDQRSADGWRGRQLPRLFADAGLEPVVVAYVHVDTTSDSYLFALAERVACSAADAGAIEEKAIETWLARLRKRRSEGRFFSSINYVICRGEVHS